MLAADRAEDIGVLRNEGVHLVKVHGVGVDLRVSVADELVGPVPGLAGLAVQQGVGKARHVAGGDPSLGVHDDGGVQAHVVGGLLDELLPPGLLHVVFELHAQGAVVPGVGQAAVNFTAGIDDAPALAEIDDHLHGLFAVFHFHTLLIADMVAYAAANGKNKKRPEPIWLRANFTKSVVPPEFPP